MLQHRQDRVGDWNRWKLSCFLVTPYGEGYNWWRRIWLQSFTRRIWKCKGFKVPREELVAVIYIVLASVHVFFIRVVEVVERMIKSSGYSKVTRKVINL